MTRRLLGSGLVAVALAACASAPEGPTIGASGTRAAETEGGEVAEPVQVMRTTTPIPVPAPGAPREELGETVQQVWELVEGVVEDRPPEPPSGASEASITRWAREEFAPFLQARIEAMHTVDAAMLELRSAPPEERGLAAALFGYMNEDTAASARGAPVPASIAQDEELLDVYVETLTQALEPIARQAAHGYALCVSLFSERLEGPWGPYAGYCDQRGAEVVEVYGLVELDSPERTVPAEGGDPAEGATSAGGTDAAEGAAGGTDPAESPAEGPAEGTDPAETAAPEGADESSDAEAPDRR